MKELDFRTMKCPAPVVETRKALLASPQDRFTVLLGDTMARDNVSRLAGTLGYEVQVAETGSDFRLDLKPGSQGVSQDTPDGTVSGKTIVYIGNDSMGGDNRPLGQKLMVAFVCTLLELDQTPDMAIFINEGVRLTTEGSPVLEALEQLANRGTDVVSCGLCLDFFDLKDQLKVGRVGNMFETVESFASAGRIIRP